MTGNNLNKTTVVKNTFMLYIRMFVLMIVGFITTRIVLRSLGEVDYGLNNAVAGFVALFGVLTGSLNAAISRFLTYELGRGNQSKLNSIFSSAVFIQFGMALIIAFFVETIGMWFLNNHMTIPIDRLVASQWVLHFSVINTIITLTFVPYSAAIISHEQMNIYAYVSIAEGLLQLSIAYLISLDVWGDKLIFYAGAICFVSFLTNTLYRVYCTRHFEECKLRWIFDKDILKSVGEFAGWNMIGAGAGILRTQGINILFNMFFGPTVNAAQGISNQSSGLATKFSDGFTTAIKPQITKSYAARDFEYLYSLIYQGTRMSFFLFFLLALPIYVETDGLLKLWLVEYPEHTVTFVRIALFVIFIDNIVSNPLITLMLATGKIRNYQLIVGGLNLLCFPIAYVLLKLGSSSEFVLIMTALISIVCFIARIVMLKGMVDFPIKEYTKQVIIQLLMVIILSSVLPVATHMLLPSGIWWIFLNCLIAAVSVTITMWLIGFTKSEKQAIKNRINRIIH